MSAAAKCVQGRSVDQGGSGIVRYATGQTDEGQQGAFQLVSLLGPFLLSLCLKHSSQTDPAKSVTPCHSSAQKPLVARPLSQSESCSYQISNLTAQQPLFSPHSLPVTGLHSDLSAHPLLGKCALTPGPLHLPAPLSGTVFPLQSPGFTISDLYSDCHLLSGKSI